MTTLTTTGAETETAQTTEEKALAFPGRDEVLKHFAKEVTKEPEPVEPAPNGEAEEPTETDDALSQSAETVTDEASDEAAEENHLDDGLREALPADIQEKINRRISKEVAKTKAEREAREAAEAKLAEAETKEATAPDTTANRSPALADIHEPAKLAVEQQRAEEALEQAEELLGNLEDDPLTVERTLRAAKLDDRMPRDAAGEPDYTPAGMRKFLGTVKRNADRTLRRDIPKRETFLKQAEVSAQEALAFMPELKDGKSDRTKLFLQVIRDNPEIRNKSNWPVKVAVAVLGLERLDEWKAAKAKTTAPAKPKTEKPVTIPAPKAQPANVSKTKPTLDANAVADKLLNGERAARLDYIKTLVPKMP